MKTKNNVYSVIKEDWDRYVQLNEVPVGGGNI